MPGWAYSSGTRKKIKERRGGGGEGGREGVQIAVARRGNKRRVDIIKIHALICIQIEMIYFALDRSKGE